jgi:Undecaprenyl-phosphate galactose phosphotransferase WbaP
MTDFIADESDDVEFLAPLGKAKQLNVAEPHPSRRATGHYDTFRSGAGNIHGSDDSDSGLGLTRSVASFLKPTPVSATSTSALVRLYLQTVTPLVISDIFALVLSAFLGLAALLAWSAMRHSLVPVIHIAPVDVLAFLPLLCAYWYGGLYPAIGMHPVVELQKITKLNTTAFLFAMATLLVAGATREWGAFFIGTWAVSMAAVPVSRTLTRRLSSAGSWWGYPAVVIGSGRDAATIVDALLARPQSGLRPCGIIDPQDRNIGSVSGVPYLGQSQDLKPLAAAYALVALPDMTGASLAEALETYRNRFPHLLVLSGVSGLPSLWRDPRDCGGGIAGVELRNKLLLPWPRFVKRVIDLALTVATMCLASPLLAAIALAVKVTSPGPVFFGHTRLGRNGRRFTAWKFRTMRPDADAILQQLLLTDPGARTEWDRDHKLRNDPRITCIGQWLRRTSLDELPQLWNVLSGDMSLVGPRPIVDAEIARYGDIFRLYAEVPPGITGLWQVSGRNNTTYPERIRLDEFYVRNWSPWLDLYILARTVKTIIRQEGAY